MISCSLKNVVYNYPNREISALSNVNIDIEKGSFVLISGTSGSGKSTLGKVIKGIVPELYGGVLKGSVKSENMGYVLQDPEKQMLMTTVERELAFGMENLAVPYPMMRKRVAEILDYIGLSKFRKQETKTLSGGQQQKLAIGCALGMGFDALILDEPTGQLDPVSSSEIIDLLKRLNDEKGMTIILIEQKIDLLLEIADRIVFLDNGKIAFDGSPKDFVMDDIDKSDLVFSDLTLSFKKAVKNNIIKKCPLSIKSARNILNNFEIPDIEIKDSNDDELDFNVVEIKNMIFSYDGKIPSLKVKNFTVKKGMIVGVIGENGSGKSTLLKVIAGILKPQRGSVKINGKVGYLSQNPNDYFFENSLKEEISQVLYNNKICWGTELDKKLEILGISNMLSLNPRELSGGEKQRAALATVLALEPEILILDEPTRGLNRGLKRILANLLIELKKIGMTIIIVSHDMSLIGDVAEKSAIISGGSFEIMDNTRTLLSEGIFYVSDVGRLFSPYGMQAVKNSEGEQILLNLKGR